MTLQNLKRLAIHYKEVKRFKELQDVEKKIAIKSPSKQKVVKK